MRIDVTQEDIDKGKRRHASCCPIGLAIQRAIGRSLVIVGTDGHVHYGSAREINTCTMPHEAIAFVTRFDQQQSVQPFSFDLPLEAR